MSRMRVNGVDAVYASVNDGSLPIMQGSQSKKSQDVEHMAEAKSRKATARKKRT